MGFCQCLFTWLRVLMILIQSTKECWLLMVHSHWLITKCEPGAIIDWKQSSFWVWDNSRRLVATTLKFAVITLYLAFETFCSLISLTSYWEPDSLRVEGLLNLHSPPKNKNLRGYRTVKSRLTQNKLTNMLLSSFKRWKCLVTVWKTSFMFSPVLALVSTKCEI